MKLLAFLMLLVFASTSTADDVIVGAFGQTLGAVVDPNIHSPLGENWRGALRYGFDPDKPYHVFKSYYITATPVTKRIHRITAKGEISTQSSCGIELYVLRKVLEEKYPDARKYKKDDVATFTTNDPDSRTTHIELSCSYYINAERTDDKNNAHQAFLTMYYMDMDLHNIVLDERASQVDKSNF